MPAAVQYPRAGEVWRHYKGTEYTITEVTVDSETLQLRVSYSDGDSPTWSRVMSGRNPITHKPCGWHDPLPDGSPRYTRVIR